MAYRFPGRPPGTDLSDSDSFSMASSIGDYLEEGDGAYRSSAAEFLAFEEEQDRRRFLAFEEEQNRRKHQFHLPRYRQTTLHEHFIPQQRQSPLAMSRFPGRPPGSPTPDHSDLFSNSFGYEDRLASFAEDFRQSLDADADEDETFWRQAIPDDDYYTDSDDDDDDFLWSLQQNQQQQTQRIDPTAFSFSFSGFNISNPLATVTPPSEAISYLIPSQVVLSKPKGVATTDSSNSSADIVFVADTNVRLSKLKGSPIGIGDDTSVAVTDKTDGTMSDGGIGFEDEVSAADPNGSDGIYTSIGLGNIFDLFYPLPEDEFIFESQDSREFALGALLYHAFSPCVYIRCRRSSLRWVTALIYKLLLIAWNL